MLRFARCLVAFAALLAVPAWAQEVVKVTEFPKPFQKIELADGDSVVFLGDSITHQVLYTQYLEDFFYTRFPKQRFKFHNAGVGGAKAWDALQRFDRDVAAYKPKYVTVLLGMNDGTYRPFDQATFDTYRKDMTTLVERIEAAGATPILMTPTMYDARAARMSGRQTPEAHEFYNSVLAYYGTWLRDVAEREGHGFIDMWSPLNDLTHAARKADPQFTLIKDAVHPDAPGQLVMAYAVLDDAGLRGQVSTIRIDAAKEKPTGSAQRGKLTDLARSGDGLSFTFEAESLPFVVPEAARPGAELLRLGHRAGREAVVVNGLPPGRYEIVIDGESVGSYPANRLAAGVELQDNPKTPQYQQALKVAELNKTRNEGPVRALRGEWGIFQQYARIKRTASEQPQNAQVAQQLQQQEQRIAGLEERVAKHEADAKAIEDEIFKINVPQPRRYEIRRAADVGRTAAAKAP